MLLVFSGSGGDTYSFAPGRFSRARFEKLASLLRMRSLRAAPPLVPDSPLGLDARAHAESALRALYRIWDNPH